MSTILKPFLCNISETCFLSISLSVLESNRLITFLVNLEINPLAFIVEQAGGRATNGKQRIMEIEPKSLHQRTPLYIGSEEEVLEVEKYLNDD